MQRGFLCVLGMIAAVLWWPGGALAESINIDFWNARGTPSSAFGGAAGQPGTWASITSTGITSNLPGLDGSPTDVSLSLASPGALSMGTGGTSGALGALLDDNFFTSVGNSSGWTVTLSGIDPGTYDVYVYAPANTSVSTGAYTINGVPMPSLPGADPLTSFVLGTNYDVLSGLSVSGGTITLSSSDPWYVGLSGIQVVIPEPGTALLLAAGLAVLAVRRRARA
jgi:hypothetical protein